MALKHNDIFKPRTYPLVAFASLSGVARTISLRCDAKQSDRRYEKFDGLLAKMGFFELGIYLPKPFVKGSQPDYLDTTDGVPVVNTLAIQKLAINVSHCRYITEDDFAKLSDDKKLTKGDVLLTMDGGTSIGKPVVFDLSDDFTVDSHVAILRPSGISPATLVYLLASPFAQIQFQRAESGASGQTAVTEEDVRRFRFPTASPKQLEALVSAVDKKRREIQKEKERLAKEEQGQWDALFDGLLKAS
jgi:hypothetical protein